MSVLVLCKFTLLGFETLKIPIEQVSFTLGCKFTLLGFETLSNPQIAIPNLCKFTLLGFETALTQVAGKTRLKCKFTLLGFETIKICLK